METYQLKYFINVAETGSFSEASRRCFISQSAISQQIKSLETELGTDLFIRAPHSISITEAGEELLPMARSLVQNMERTKEYMLSLNGDLHGSLNVGFGSFIEPYVRKAAVRMYREYPNVKMCATFSRTTQLNQMLRDGELDLAFSMNTAHCNEHIETMPGIEFRLGCVMHKDNPLSRKDEVTFDDLMQQAIIMPEVGDRVIATIKSYCHLPIEKLCSRIVVNDADAALKMVEELSELITFLPRMYVTNHPSLVCKSIRDLNMPLMSNAHWLKDVYHKRVAQVFLQFVREEASKIGG